MHQDNVADVPIDVHTGNVADIEQSSSQVHREPLPEDASGFAHAAQDTEGFAVGGTQHHSNADASGGRIHQTSPDAAGVTHQGHLSEQAHQQPHGQPAIGARPIKAGTATGPKVVSNVKKVGAKAAPAPARPKEVPKASDTWSEAFRGRVAAINDQVKSLNHKLDDFDK